MQLPDMNLLVALDALLDEGSVVGAARRMNLSPAAMSRTLTRIRDALGDPVLVRAGRGLVPTPKALELRSQVRDLVEQAALLFRSADQVDLLSLRRRFNVRANDFFVGVYGGRLMTRWSVRHRCANCVSCLKATATTRPCGKGGSICGSATPGR